MLLTILALISNQKIIYIFHYTTIDSVEFEGLTDESVIGLLPHLSPDEADFKHTVLENTAFMIRKSLDIKEDPENGTVRGLSWRYQGKNKDEQGNETDFYIPDVTSLTLQDYEYFEQRFQKCSGLFPKTEYGLLVYLGKKLRTQNVTSLKKS